MKLTKSTRISVLSLAMFGATALHAPQSHAIVGLATGNIGVAVAGAVTGLTGGALLLLNRAGIGSRGLDLLSYVLIGLGVVLLDDESGSGVEFHPLTSAQSAQLGLTSAQMQAYNGEIDQVNAIYRSVVKETQDRNQDSTSADELMSFAEGRWDEYGRTLSPAANAALLKVRASVADKLQSAGQG